MMKSNKETLRFITPSHEEFEIEISSWSDSLRGLKYFEQLNVTDLKYKLSQSGHCACSPDRIRIILRDVELSDDRSIRDVIDLTKETPYSKQETLLIVVKMLQEEVSKYFNFMYQDFIRAVSPVNGARDVPLDATIQINIGVNLFQYTLYVPALLDDNILSDSRQLKAKCDGQMLAYFNGNYKEAAKRGFRQWLDAAECPSLPKILLLQADPSLVQRVEDIAYNIYGVNDGYEGGDIHSWQRYTSQLPVDCRLSSDFIHTLHMPEQSIITMQPLLPLKPGCCYAILLCHNAVAMPADLLQADLPYFGTDGVLANDFLSFFWTVGTAVEEEKEARGGNDGHEELQEHEPEGVNEHPKIIDDVDY